MELLKQKGIQRTQIEKELNYAEKYITQQLAKGGNERLYKAIKKYYDSVPYAEDAKSNLPPAAESNNDLYREKYYEVLERERKALEEDKAFFKEILRTSLAGILQKTEELWARQKGTGDIVLHSLERIEGKKEGDLVKQADKQIFQIDKEAHGHGSAVAPRK